MARFLGLTCRRHAHANAALTQSYRADMARSISSKGHAQIDRLLKEKKRYDLGAASPAERTRSTVARLGDWDLQNVHMFGELGYPDPGTAIGERCDLMYLAYGNVPYRTYLQDPDGHFIRKQGLAAARAVREWMFKSPLDHTTVLLGCHGVYMNALGIALLGEGHKYVDLLLDTAFGETQGYTISFYDGQPGNFQLHCD